MTIQATLAIPRSLAIKRICEVDLQASKKHYLELQEMSFEAEEPCDFVENHIPLKNIGFKTNEMLEYVIDRPFYRFSMYENYIIVD